MANLKIFNTSRLDGPMTMNKSFYKEGMSNEEIRKDLMNRKKLLGLDYGFIPEKLFVPIQKNSNKPALYPDGKIEVLTQELVDSTEDLWDLDIYCDGILLDSGVTRVAVGYPVADCPVVIVRDMASEKIVLGHCGCEYINRHLPEQLVDGLCNKAGTKDEDIQIYVGPCAGVESYTYDTYPKWATDSTWNDCIHEEKGKYHIDMRKSIVKQLTDRNVNIENIMVSGEDTILDDRYYSNNANYNGRKDKNGRFLTGAFYDNKVLSKTLSRF